VRVEGKGLNLPPYPRFLHTLQHPPSPLGGKNPDFPANTFLARLFFFVCNCLPIGGCSDMPRPRPSAGAAAQPSGAFWPGAPKAKSWLLFKSSFSQIGGMLHDLRANFLGTSVSAQPESIPPRGGGPYSSNHDSMAPCFRLCLCLIPHPCPAIPSGDTALFCHAGKGWRRQGYGEVFFIFNIHVHYTQKNISA